MCYYLKEIQSLEENHVWGLVELPNDKLLEAKGCSDKRLGENGVVKQYKAE